jgi:hypothetical protein
MCDVLLLLLLLLLMMMMMIMICWCVQLHINESSYLQLVEVQESMSYPGLLTQVRTQQVPAACKLLCGTTAVQLHEAITHPVLFCSCVQMLPVQLPNAGRRVVWARG